jgi:hypothetical protein
MTIVLWIIQGLLALTFLLTGFLKAFTTLEGLKKYMASWAPIAWIIPLVELAI